MQHDANPFGNPTLIIYLFLEPLGTMEFRSNFGLQLGLAGGPNEVLPPLRWTRLLITTPAWLQVSLKCHGVTGMVAVTTVTRRHRLMNIHGEQSSGCLLSPCPSSRANKEDLSGFHG